MKSSAGRSKAGSSSGRSARVAGSEPEATAASGRVSGGSPATRSRGFGARTGALELLDAAARGKFPSTLYLEGPSEPLKAAFLGELKHAWAAHVPHSPT